MTNGEVIGILARDLPHFRPELLIGLVQDGDTVLATYEYVEPGRRPCFTTPTKVAVISICKKKVIGQHG